MSIGKNTQGRTIILDTSVIRYEVEPASFHFKNCGKTSANIVPIVHTKNRKGEKRGKGICRLYGAGSEIGIINAIALATVDRINAKKLDISIFKGKKSYSAQSLAKEHGLI